MSNIEKIKENEERFYFEDLDFLDEAMIVKKSREEGPPKEQFLPVIMLASFLQMKSTINLSKQVFMLKKVSM